MEATVECVVQNSPPPAELTLAWQCKRWNALPEAGGLYVQDYRTIHLMTALSNIYDVVAHVRSLKGKEIHRLTDAQRKLLRYLMDKEVIFHA